VRRRACMVHSGRPSLFTCLPKNAPTGALSRGPHGCGPRSRPALGHTQSGCCRRTRAAWTCLCPRLAPSPATRRLPQARHRARGTAGPAWSLGLGAMPWARAGVSQTVRAGMGAGCVRRRLQMVSRPLAHCAPSRRTAALCCTSRSRPGAERGPSTAGPAVFTVQRPHASRAGCCLPCRRAARARAAERPGPRRRGCGPAVYCATAPPAAARWCVPQSTGHRMHGRCRPTGRRCTCQGDVRLCCSDGPGSGGCLHAWPLPLCRAW